MPKPKTEDLSIIRDSPRSGAKTRALLQAVPEAQGRRTDITSPASGEVVSRQHAIEQADIAKGTAHRWMLLPQAWPDDSEWCERLERAQELRYSRILGEARSIVRAHEPEPRQAKRRFTSSSPSVASWGSAGP